MRRNGCRLQRAPADPFGWKALRGAMGVRSGYRSPFDNLSPVIAQLHEGVRVCPATARGGRRSGDLRVPPPSCWAAKEADCRISSSPPRMRLTIPMQTPVESLNVAIAATLVIYEARQRQPAASCRSLTSHNPAREEGTGALAERMRPHAGLIRQPGGAHRPRTPAAACHRSGPAAVDHSLGTAGHQQTQRSARLIANVTRFTSSPSARCCRHQGDSRGHVGSETRACLRSNADHPLHRRDPSLQQGAARRLLAPRRAGHRHPHRRDDRESVVRGERSAPVALQGLSPRAARRRRCRSAATPGAPRRDAAQPLEVTADDEALAGIGRYANGDARRVERRNRGSGTGAKQSSDRCAARRRAHRTVPSSMTKRRGTLQPDLGAPQVDAQQRPDATVLARADDRVRRRSALHRAAPGAVRIGRQRRSASALHRGRRQRCRALRWNARGNTALAQAASMAVAAKSNAVYRAYSAAAEAASKNSQSRFRSPAKRATR